MRLPRRVVLPFGYVVTVKLATSREMDDAGGSDCDGLWDCDSRRILIRKRLAAARRRWVLVHELFHALNDMQHAFRNQGKL
jgi:Zn-dependent peptidase ImmA (M78 family)